MRSMTAFTYDSISLYGRKIGCNLLSFNSRFLDIRLTVPHAFQPFQMEIYDMIRDNIARGRIEMKIDIEESVSDSEIYMENVKNYIERLKEIKKEFNLNGDISISMISAIPEIFRDDSVIQPEWEDMESFIGSMIQDLIKMKEREGEFIKEDLQDKVGKLEDALDFIKSKSKKSSEEQKDKILSDIKRLNDLDIKLTRDDINLFAFKGDVDEELVRLESHTEYFGELLNEGEIVGRRLRFILQEMFREVNTIGSKAYSADIVHRVIDIKELLDEMKEQVENLE